MLKSASTRVSGCRRSHRFPKQGGKLQMQQCLNADSLLTWQKNSPWSEPPGRSITRGKPPPQAEPRGAPSRDPKQQGCVRTGRLPCSLEEPMPDVAAW